MMRVAPPAGTTLTAAALELLYPVHRVRDSSQSVTSSTTLVDDDTLHVPVDAGAIYLVRAVLIVGGSTSGDIRVAWSIPVGADGTRAGVGPQASVSSNASTTVAYRSRSWTDTAIYGTTTGVSGGIIEDGTLLTGATAGLLQLRWAQDTSNATATSVHAASTLTLERIS